MPSTEVEQEFEQVKQRHSGGITQTIKNTSPFIFIAIVGLIVLFFWMMKGGANVTITQNNKQIHLGYFDTIKEALNARMRGEIKYWGTECH